MVRIKSVLTSILATAYIALPRAAYAQGNAWSSRCVQDGDVATIQGLECLFSNVLQIIVSVAGIVFFIMFIVGGFKYITSFGDQKAMAQSNTTLTNAILAIVGLIGSFVALRLIGTITGLNVTNFLIPG